MANNKQIHNVAIVGTGVIGASWAALYLARGLNVTATDPAPNAEANLWKYVDEAWKDLTAIGLSPNASRDHLKFTTDLKKALADADLVQGERTRTEGFQDQALRRHRCGDSAGCDHRIELVRTDYEYDAIRL